MHPLSCAEEANSPMIHTWRENKKCAFVQSLIQLYLCNSIAIRLLEILIVQHQDYFYSNTVECRYPFTDATTLVDRGHKTERLTKWTKKFSFVGPRFFSPVTKSMISCWNLIIRFGYFWHSCTKRWDNNLKNSKFPWAQTHHSYTGLWVDHNNTQ